MVVSIHQSETYLNLPSICLSQVLRMDFRADLLTCVLRFRRNEGGIDQFAEGYNTFGFQRHLHTMRVRRNYISLVFLCGF